MRGHQAVSIIGQVFGRLTVTERSGSDKAGRARWKCVCSCGRELTIAGYMLRDGTYQSCGCFRREFTRSRNLRHGHTEDGNESPEYRCWRHMVARCDDPKNNRFHRYGGRGISTCERWRDFAAFLADVGPRPSPRHSIDRIDNDGNYEPGNVRWATRIEQARTARTIRREREADGRYLRRIVPTPEEPAAVADFRAAKARRRARA